jgi:hypothetical protein
VKLVQSMRLDMHRNKPFWISVASGAVWGLIGFAVGYLVDSRAGLHVAVALAGGIVAAPFIGMLMGQVSRVFGYVEEVVLRIIIAGASLYAASALFIIASLLWQSIRAGHLHEHIWTDSFGMAAWAF